MRQCMWSIRHNGRHILGEGREGNAQHTTIPQNISSYRIYVFTKYGDDYSGEGKAAATVYFEFSHCKAASLPYFFNSP